MFQIRTFLRVLDYQRLTRFRHTQKVSNSRTIYLSVYLSIYLSFYLSIYLFIYLCIGLSIFLFFSPGSVILKRWANFWSSHPSIHPSIYLSNYLSLYLTIYLTVHLSIYLSIVVSICLIFILFPRFCHPQKVTKLDQAAHLSIYLFIYMFYRSIFPPFFPPICLSKICVFFCLTVYVHVDMQRYIFFF